MSWWMSTRPGAGNIDQLMREQDIVGVLMQVLGCNERHARSIYMFHIDRPGPASMFQDRSEESFEEPPEVPPLIKVPWEPSAVPGVS